MDISLVNLRLEDIAAPKKRAHEDGTNIPNPRPRLTSKVSCATKECVLSIRNVIMSCVRQICGTDELFWQEKVNRLSAYFATKFVVAMHPCYNQSDQMLTSLYEKLSDFDNIQLMQIEMLILSSTNWSPPCIFEMPNSCDDMLIVDDIYTCALNQLAQTNATVVETQGLNEDWNVLPKVYDATIYTHFEGSIQHFFGHVKEVSSCTNPLTTYSFEQMLGRGSYGFVGKYVDKTKLEKDVAIKWVQCISHGKHGVDHEIVKEVVVGNFIDSKYVTKTNCAYLAKLPSGVMYVGIVMDIATQNLAQYIHDNILWLSNPNNKDYRILIIKHILQGLHDMHSKGFSHSDFKPHQILITSTGRSGTASPVSSVQIADLGNVQMTGTACRRPAPFNFPGHRIGTSCYIAPETMLSNDYGNKCDMWGAGLVFLELYCGLLKGRLFDDIPISIKNPITDWLLLFSVNVLNFQEWHTYWKSNYADRQTKISFVQRCIVERVNYYFNVDRFCALMTKDWFSEIDSWRKELNATHVGQSHSADYKMQNDALALVEDKLMSKLETDSFDWEREKQLKLLLLQERKPLPKLALVSDLLSKDSEKKLSLDKETLQQLEELEETTLPELSSEFKLISRLLVTNPDNRPSAKEALGILIPKDKPPAATSMQP